MRMLIAFIISVLIYALLIWLFFYQLPKIEIPRKKSNTHVVKLNIIDIPLAPKPVPVINPQPIVKTIIPKASKVVKKEPLKKKKLIPKKSVKKKIVKKKPLKKRLPKKKIVVQKKPSEKKVFVPKKVVEKKVVKKKVVKKKVVKKKVVKKVVKKEKVVKKKSEALEEFENEMVYISEPMIKAKTPKTQSSDLGSFLSTPATPVSPWSYPNDKIRKLYGTGFHNFTPTQKEFIENNLNTIQEITQRTLTQRGYPEGAGRTGQQGTNVVSFNLHPNGDISGLYLKTRIGYRALDDNTLSLIRVAYMDYPYPSTTTKIIFYVTYSIYGY